MKTYITIFLSLFFLWGCKKTDNDNIRIAESDIIYTEVNPNIKIGYDTTTQKSWLHVDLNHDSINDFVISAGYAYVYPDTIHPLGRYFVLGPSINNWDSNFVYGIYLKLLKKDYIISDSLTPHNEFMFEGFSSTCMSDTCGYIGLSLIKNKKKYYGWIELDWNTTNQVVTVRSFAVRKSPGILIRTGQIN